MDGFFGRKINFRQLLPIFTSAVFSFCRVAHTSIHYQLLVKNFLPVFRTIQFNLASTEAVDVWTCQVIHTQHFQTGATHITNGFEYHPTPVLYHQEYDQLLVH